MMDVTCAVFICIFQRTLGNGKINVWKFYAHTIPPSIQKLTVANMCNNTCADSSTPQYVCKDINHSWKWETHLWDIVNISTDV